ncbi:hypothetical protein JB92DRAFT_2838237 [Gautieria morchelliformis]|nr:hypothetical protein JB92DRAFT_2838237 [Gautieria morchelliformis]
MNRKLCKVSARAKKALCEDERATQACETTTSLHTASQCTHLARPRPQASASSRSCYPHGLSTSPPGLRHPECHLADPGVRVRRRVLQDEHAGRGVQPRPRVGGLQAPRDALQLTRKQSQRESVDDERPSEIESRFRAYRDSRDMISGMPSRRAYASARLFR